MAHSISFERGRKAKKTQTPDIGFADVLLLLLAELRLSPSERRSFLRGMAKLWMRVKPDRKRFLQHYAQFSDMAEAKGISPLQFGRYLTKTLKHCKRLPKLDKSIHPFVGSESIVGLPPFTLEELMGPTPKPQQTTHK